LRVKLALLLLPEFWVILKAHEKFHLTDLDYIEGLEEGVCDGSD